MHEQHRFNILRIDASAQRDDSITRQLGDEVVQRLLQEHPQATVTLRDLADPVGFIDDKWVQANLTDPAARNAQQRAVLGTSDRLVRELIAADVIVLTVPVYNFSVPASLKAWIDMICRARLSFRYTEHGPVGLLRDRPVYLVMASGGIPFGGPADFASGYLRHILAFIGIHDVRMVQAERTNRDAGASTRAALNRLTHWLPGRAVPATA
jgi:FMN-dependent NADH-azoreductase